MSRVAIKQEDSMLMVADVLRGMAAALREQSGASNAASSMLLAQVLDAGTLIEVRQIVELPELALNERALQLGGAALPDDARALMELADADVRRDARDRLQNGAPVVRVRAWILLQTISAIRHAVAETIRQAVAGLWRRGA